MKIKMWDTVEHGGERFVILNIKHEQTMDGMILIVSCFDPDSADKKQKEAIKVDQTQNQMIETLKRLTGEGGPLGGMFGGRHD